VRFLIKNVSVFSISFAKRNPFEKNNQNENVSYNINECMKIVFYIIIIYLFVQIDERFENIQPRPRRNSVRR